MRKYLFVAFVALGISVKAQVTFEHSYDSASSFATGSPALQNQLMIVKFEISGERYVRINKTSQNICVYDMNHSLLKNIPFPNIVTPNSNGVAILYLSESLFDTDSGMEFIYTCTTPSGYYTGIYNDDGSLIFSDIGFPVIISNFLQQQYPIYNTLQGTKMILSYTNGQARVFGLVGTLSTSIQETNGQLMQAQGGKFSNLYPNPSNGAATLQYELPKGEKEGEIILYNTQGAEVKRYKVDSTFKDLILDNSQLLVGTYFYQLVTNKGAVGVKKMVVVK